MMFQFFFIKYYFFKYFSNIKELLKGIINYNIFKQLLKELFLDEYNIKFTAFIL